MELLGEATAPTSLTRPFQAYIRPLTKTATPAVRNKRVRPPPPRDVQLFRNLKRALHRRIPLQRQIRNAILRARRSWDNGMYGDETMALPARHGPFVGNMAPCCFFSKSGLQNGYEVRLVLSTWGELVAVWGVYGITCVPLRFVQEDHRQALPVPGLPVNCAQCEDTMWDVYVCSNCGAPACLWPN